METISGYLCAASHPIFFARPPRSDAGLYLISGRPIHLTSVYGSITLRAAPARSSSTRLHVRGSSSAKVSEEASYPPLVGESDLLIVGPGVLGRLVAEQWRKEFPGSQIYGQTATTNHHDELIKMGINPLLKGSEFAYSVPYVIFCAPPSQSLDYPGDLRIAASKWSGEGSFLFTSSSALYDCSDNGPCNEDTPIIPLGRSPKTDVLLNAEKVVLDSGGCVLRLAGLYISFMESAHAFWLKKGIVEARPDHFLNLIHYEDSASLSVTILKKKLRSRVFMGCDNHPVTRLNDFKFLQNADKK
ncbi:hypothetical protein SAY87_022343 [Trapa incisa]|uniref:NAD(P)-binding Rossmann-fold superfamily protein n=1 Tax=Trapa incisa TaxID=236973 RepID=A0AAN7Q425_9MYRT|nr:hypothetical protein SAY87_022343 [Trapa incisa]